jgi:hypothetical protein
MLGTWQGIYLFEHRRADEPAGRVPGAATKTTGSPHRREVVLHLLGS